MGTASAKVILILQYDEVKYNYLCILGKFVLQRVTWSDAGEAGTGTGWAALPGFISVPIVTFCSEW
jgi:hypothetical protein